MRVTIQRCMVQQGIVSAEQEAAVLIMSGRVYVKGQRVRPGQMVPEDADIQVKGLHERYVSKGGYKLEGALRTFGVDVDGMVCIDAGASTGGFTDCLVKHGAQLVYAVDVGFGQLMGSLRQDPRVVNLERTNIGDARLLSLSPRPHLGTVDLSYLSLTSAIPQFAAILGRQGMLLCLVKPLFETDDHVARRAGVLAEDAYAPLLRGLISRINAMDGCTVQAVCHSPVTGNQGTVEFFLQVLLGGEQAAPDLEADIAGSVQAALLLPNYRKTAFDVHEEDPIVPV